MYAATVVEFKAKDTRSPISLPIKTRRREEMTRKFKQKDYWIRNSAP
jgi:hypothetical protein